MFCALVVTAECSVDELFNIYTLFYCLSSASAGFDPRPPPGLRARTLLGYFRSHTPNLPTMENPEGAHGLKETTIQYYAPTLPLCAQSFLIDFQVDFPFDIHL